MDGGRFWRSCSGSAPSGCWRGWGWGGVRFFSQLCVGVEHEWISVDVLEGAVLWACGTDWLIRVPILQLFLFPASLAL